MKPLRTFPSPVNWDWRFLLTTGLILGSLVGLDSLSHGAPPLLPKKLADFPQMAGNWKGVDVPLEEGVEEVLGATDLLSRIYVGPQERNNLGLFVAFFASQRKGGAIHSPKNCLPGAGWSVVSGNIIPISMPGYPEPVMVNRYVVQKGRDKQVVLYWYQSQGRIVASEYSAKMYLIWDAATRNRTDGALVRVVSPVIGGDETAALKRAVSFIQEIAPPLQSYLPG